ncbi:MAG: DUF2283 domain-containing protein [Dehalococcoidia bacterium]|nr:DUF2283 domain-containing protein [Dehalococcoidia bacterium]
MGLTIAYDGDVDAMAVDFVPRGANDTDHTEELDEFRRIDFDAAGEPIGLDLTYVSEGVNLDGLPHRDELAAAFRSLATLAHA